MKKNFLVTFFFISFCCFSFSQTLNNPREHLLMDFGWRFAFGHPYNTEKDFNSGTGYFSYFAKAGYGDGAAALNFDDRSWRQLDLPHDWAVEQSFDSAASFSHGFKAIGRNFPDKSVGWYRKSFSIPTSDMGRRISIAFDGVFRNSIVWVNGHFLGNELSGYLGFEYDITDYLNYGGENEVAVRVDATMEEGWFYEGAGIYRHVWLNKTSPLHVINNGTGITTKVNGNMAGVNTIVTVENHANKNVAFTVGQKILDSSGKVVGENIPKGFSLHAFETKDLSSDMKVADATLWDIDNPYMYALVTTLRVGDSVTDNFVTRFGIRTIRFDANEGFFLNGRHVEIKGTDNHQDHAGVGTAIPDELQEFRIATLKSFGTNAYRCSHNPPTPELLDACDKLGMLVIDENRLMGITDYHLNALKKLIERDRNHPCIISWSIGNEEWAMENTVVGARIATTMQDYIKTLDTTRPVTLAFSGGVDNGNSTTIELLGYNYIVNKNTDGHHQKFPWQLSWGTEEGSTVATRGIYANDLARHYREAYDEPQHATNYFSIEQGWNYYVKRPYLAGMYIWTGFDYRGEPTPFGWPSVVSLFGMVDLCGFPKDDAWYLRSWWTDKHVVHLFPHWSWPGKEGKEIRVWVYSNCEEVELLLNKKSLGKKVMQRNSHLEWNVKYTPGTLEAIGFNDGKRITADKVQTTGDAYSIRLIPNKTSIKSNKEDVAMITVDVLDKNNLQIPTTGNEITFQIEGPAKIIGVGNGNPTSLEKDKFLPTIKVVRIENLKEKYVKDIADSSDTSPNYDDHEWQHAFTEERTREFGDSVKAVVYRGSFNMPQLTGNEKVHFFYKSLGKLQSIFINGKEIGNNLSESPHGSEFTLQGTDLRSGLNVITIKAIPLLKTHSWDFINMDPGVIQIIIPAESWKRKLFNGLAQVIIQSTGKEGDIIITATSDNLKTGQVKIKAIKAVMRPSVTE